MTTQNENISASAVKELREKTGAGMMDCKKALVEARGDFEEAVQWLRKKGLSAAAKRSDKIALEGLVAVNVANKSGVVIEVNSETDFVSRNDRFQSLVSEISALALQHKTLDAVMSVRMKNGQCVSDAIAENAAVVGENINLRRVDFIQVENGVISSYVHNSLGNNLGKIGVLVAINSTAEPIKLDKLGRQIAMHIAAANPQSMDISGVSPILIEREKEVFAAQSKAAGKPEHIIEKMIDGRIRKFFEEVVLMEQIFIIDGKTKISEVISNASKELGHDVKISGFIRYALGETVNGK